MKLKATKKQMKDNFYRIISIGYCDAQYLLKYEKPFAYSAGIYGWACDYYDIDGVLISTGYSTIGNKNTKDNYKIIEEYEKKASKLDNKEKNRQLLKELINRLSKEN